MTLCEAIQWKFDTKSARCQQITRKLAIFVGSTNVPNSLVENTEFKSLMETLEPQYPMPSRTLIGKESFVRREGKHSKISVWGTKSEFVLRYLDKKGDVIIIPWDNSTFFQSSGSQASSSHTRCVENASLTQCCKHLWYNWWSSLGVEYPSFNNSSYSYW